MSVDVVPPAGKGIKGRRVEGRPGRFDPSTPLHMTTRRAARSGYPNTTPSINGSLEDEESPRASLSEDLTRAALPNEQPSQSSPGTHHSTDLTNTVVHPTSPQSLNDPLETPTRLRSLDAVTELADVSAQSMAAATRKRKRSPSTGPSISDDHKPSELYTSHLTDKPSDSDLAVESAALPSFSINDADTERAPSLDAQASDDVPTEDDSDQDQNDKTIAIEGPSMDATPAVSAGGSPASSISSSAGIGKLRSIKANTTFASQENDIGVYADDDDEIDDAEDGAAANASHAKRKFGGKRRRAIHQNIRVELALRRQLELKKAYRSIARELKGVLNELADRTLNVLNEEEHNYLRATEYDAVKAGLDAALEARKQLISRQRDFQLGVLLEKRRREEAIRERECRIFIENLRDAAIQRLQHDFLVVTRECQLNDAGSIADTEDEDDVVPRPKRVKYHFKRAGPIDMACESRSRLAVEVERSVDDLLLRTRMIDMLRKLSQNERPVSVPAFAVMDNVPRRAADARQQEVECTQTLASAAEEVERVSNLTIPNDQAVALQILGDLCSQLVMPASAQQTGAAPPPSHYDQPPPMTPTRLRPGLIIPPPPPPLPIIVELSPRTSQIFREKYEHNKQPPLTPRQMEATFGSPFALASREPSQPSASLFIDRSSGLPPLAAKPLDINQHRRDFPGLHVKTQAQQGYSPLQSQHGRPEFMYDLALGNSSAPLQSPRPILPQEQRQTAPYPDHLDRRSKSLDDLYPFEPSRKQPEPPSGFGPSRLPRTDDRDHTHGHDDRPPFTLFDPTRNDDRLNGPMQYPLLHPRAAVPPAPAHRFVFDSEELLHHRRKPSATVKDEPRPEAVAVDQAIGHKPDQSIKFKHNTHAFGKPRKPNKAERGGASRRDKKREKLKHQTSRPPTASSASSPTTIRPPPLHTPTDSAVRPPSWPMPTLLPHTVPSQMPSVTLSASGPLTQFGLGHSPTAHDLGPQQHHRHSLPPHQLPAWHHPTITPLFAVPQHAPQPPQTGLEQFRNHPHFPGPPGPPGLFPPRPSLPPHIMSSAGEYQQHGKQMLAPAIPDHGYHVAGFRPAVFNHPPAFAQQQKTHSESSSSRKRAQSDGNSRTSNWRAYEGPGKR